MAKESKQTKFRVLGVKLVTLYFMTRLQGKVETCLLAIDLEKHANRHPVTGKLVGDFDLNPTQSDKGVLMTNLCPASRHPVHTFLDHLADKSSDTPGVRPLAPPLRFPAALISAFLSNQVPGLCDRIPIIRRKDEKVSF
ncbi:hypothetical protein Bbelb_447110 [Branchiostoma belcheri]|nr:hypothetical protein Bbelb_447110 [Branchiostoma belcheri]